MVDVLPPHNTEAEEAVLGSLLIAPETIAQVAAILTPEMFYLVKHGWVYQAMLALHEKQESIDLLTLASELTRRNQLEEINGEGFLAQLVGAVPTALNVESYAGIVKELDLRRRMIRTASEIARMAYDQSLEIDRVVQKSETALLGASEGNIQGAMIPMEKAVDDFYQQVQYLSEHRNEPFGISTGYPDLDKLTGGLNKGDLVIVAARPGMGKTSLLLNLAHNAAHKFGKRVAIFSLEMGVDQLVHRFVSSETGIDSQRLRVGDLREEEWTALTDISKRMSDLMIFMDDTPSLTPLDLRIKARRIYQEHGLDMIIVDYLQLMTSEKSNARGGNDNRVQEIGYISRALKQIAREMNVPLLAGSQLSRLVEQRSDKRPMLSDLRESGSIEQDADIVSFIYRDEVYSPESEQKNIAEISLQKNRNGPTGKVNLFFDKQLTSFKNLATQRIEL